MSFHEAWLRGARTKGPEVPQVALTFDDGPDPRYTPQILSTLARHKAQATFFMLAGHVQAASTLAAEVVSAGHEAAMHLASHDRKVAKDDARTLEEIRRTREAIATATGAQAQLLRFPFGYLGRQSPALLLACHGVHTIHWSFSSMDSRLAPARIEARVRRFLFPGAIVLMHDGVAPGSRYAKDRLATIAALDGVLRACQERDLQVVSVSSLIGLSREDKLA